VNYRFSSGGVGAGDRKFNTISPCRLRNGDDDGGKVEVRTLWGRDAQRFFQEGVETLLRGRRRCKEASFSPCNPEKGRGEYILGQRMSENGDKEPLTW